MARSTTAAPQPRTLLRIGLVPATLATFTALHWAILVLQLPVLARLPDWFWPLTRKPLGEQWLLVGAAALAVVIISFVLRHAHSIALNLLLLILLGATLQFAFAAAEGRGLDGMRDRIVSTGHAEFARLSVQQPSVAHVITGYEQLVQSGQLGVYANSKPPGQLLLYMLTERLANAIQPHDGATDRLAWFQTFASYLWPVISYLVLIPMWFLARTMLSLEAAWSATFLYLFVPAVTLITLQTDQVFFPLFFATCLWTTVVAARLDRGWLLVATGALAYLCVFFSFALAVVAPFMAGICIHYTRSEADPRPNLPKLMRLLLLILLGALAMDIGFRLLFGYDSLARYRAALDYHQQWKGWDNNILDVTYYAGLNLLEYVTWIGVPLGALAILGVLRAVREFRLAEPRLAVSQFLILAGVVTALLLLGRTKAEVARLWLFLLPTICTAAAAEIHARTSPRSRWMLASVLILQAGTIYLIKLNQDFW